MADSLLAGIDFDNLPSEVPAIVIKKLAIATQERHIIGSMSKTGSFSTAGTPSDDDLKNIFPYKSNTGHKWPLNDGDPIPDLTDDIQNLLEKCITDYADIEKWNDDDTNGNSVDGSYLHLLSYAADDSGTYDNRLFEITGYTSWPDLSAYAPEEVKKWYDMLVVLRYKIQTSGVGWGTIDDYRIYEGLFDMETEPFYDIDDAFGRGARWYTSTGSSYEDPATTTPYSDFKTDNSALFGTTIDSFDESIDTPGTYPPSGGYFYAATFRRDSAGDYACFIDAFKTTFVNDFSDRITNLGITGRPVDYIHQQAVDIDESFPTGEDTNIPLPASTTADGERYYCDVSVTQDGNKDLISPDYDISPATFPTNITDIAANEAVVATVQTNSSLYGLFLEDWDGEGGFDYYTPP